MKPQIKWLVLAIATVLGVALTVSLGFWQLHRAAQKVALQESIQAQSSKAPLDVAQLRQAPDPTALVHQTVHLRGTWARKFTVYLDNRQMDARVGFFVLTPLLLEGGGAVLVQRGWIARNFEQRAVLPEVVTPQGVVELQGRIALPPSKLFEPGTAATGAIRQNLDMAQYQGETALPLMPITVLQSGEPSEGLRRAWPAANLGVDKHYGYAFQWFALALLLGGLFAWFQILKPYLLRAKEQAHHV